MPTWCDKCTLIRVMTFFRGLSVGIVLATSCIALAMPGCSAESAETDDAVEGEVAGGEAASSQDALTAHDVTAYAPVSPPEHRVTTASVAARVDDHVQDTPYARSLANVAERGTALEHLSSAAPNLGAEEPFALTIDMCQSHKPWEKRLFDWAVALSDRLHEAVPLGIAMTGVWAKAHPAELDQLLAWQRGGKLAITWVNHSSTHPLHCLDASCRRAEFLTAASVDFDEEVLGEERVVLARGMVPSTLFRFPGLVHDANRLHQLQRLSLMPLDADGWIAKRQPIRSGAVVLVHGNGNEPEGIVGFLRQVEAPARAAALASGKSALVPPVFVAPVPPR